MDVNAGSKGYLDEKNNYKDFNTAFFSRMTTFFWRGWENYSEAFSQTSKAHHETWRDRTFSKKYFKGVSQWKVLKC